MSKNNNEVLLKVDHLCQYFGFNKAVDDVSFEIHKGEVLVLLVNPVVEKQPQDVQLSVFIILLQVVYILRAKELLQEQCPIKKLLRIPRQLLRH